ncbi:MAG: DUF72 domain-containing protein [Verrucomicrobia bacterium]|nr:DUF72 domain-containing protein [Verrucomicrobiota bacterium]
MNASPPVYFGIAGWSYPDWNGILYPAGLREQLPFVARFVDLMEINSTFYRPPQARHAEAWLKQTVFKPDFRFTAKLHQDITHGGKLEPAMVRAFHEGFKPMTAAGKFTHLLAQFKFDFNDTPEHRAHLLRIREAFGNMANLTLELRHNSWQAPAALAFLETLPVTVANLDYPLARSSFNLNECRIGADRYLRLHGRNAAAWFDKKAGRNETYNYYYAHAELESIRQRAETLRRDSRSLTVVANNHFQAKEVTNILQLKAMMTGRKVPVPPGLLTRYPELKDIAAPPSA